MTAVELGDGERIARQCRRCGGWLVSAESVSSGLGPVCARHEREDARRAASDIPLFELEAIR
ncbi:DUF6011 domain-containing protein [Nocardia tengchongensis]|uniref:DUF6011 domain-containing protein n=1 Tax=Nocardia tengchongensis TaxID=2055889 RepID=UPI0036797DE1